MGRWMERTRTERQIFLGQSQLRTMEGGEEGRRGRVQREAVGKGKKNKGLKSSLYLAIASSPLLPFPRRALCHEAIRTTVEGEMWEQTRGELKRERREEEGATSVRTNEIHVFLERGKEKERYGRRETYDVYWMRESGWNKKGGMRSRMRLFGYFFGSNWKEWQRRRQGQKTERRKEGRWSGVEAGDVFFYLSRYKKRSISVIGMKVIIRDTEW